MVPSYAASVNRDPPRPSLHGRWEVRRLALLLGKRAIRDALLGRGRARAIGRCLTPPAQGLIDSLTLAFGLFLVVEVGIRSHSAHRPSPPWEQRGKGRCRRERQRSTGWLGGPMGIEPTTPGATVQCSDQLSYGHHGEADDRSYGAFRGGATRSALAP